MSDDGEGAKIEINAPPKSIEIEPTVMNQPAMLTGGIAQMSQGDLLATSPQNVKFVMGPDGQLIAMEKPPFVWKHFFIGGGIPFALYFIPLLIAMIGVGLGYEGDYHWDEMELTKDENSTMYVGDFTIESDQYLEGCYFDFEEERELYCENFDKSARIWAPDTEGEWVGNWSNDDGIMYFDSGEDYGETLQLQYQYRTESAGQDFFYTVQEISGVTCCLGFILSIVMLIVGFSQGKPGMGWGGVSALVALPVTSILALTVLW